MQRLQSRIFQRLGRCQFSTGRLRLELPTRWLKTSFGSPFKLGILFGSSEALVMGTKAGLEPSVMLDVINAGSGRNTATADKFPRCVIPRKFDFGFATELLYKDVRLCLEEGERLGVPMMVGNAVRQLVGIAKSLKGSDSDITQIVQPLEQWAGVEMKTGLHR